MDKKQFDKIIENLDSRILYCRENFGNLKTQEDVRAIPIGEVISTKNKATSELEDMTEIVMVDLYHILGMGNLTPPQTSSFIKKVKKYLSFRPLLKSLSTHFNDINDIPVINHRTRYRLKGLGNLSLISGDGELEIEDLDAISEEKDIAIAEAKKNGFVFTLTGDVIHINANQAENFIKYGNLIGAGTNIDATILHKKMTNGNTYGGVCWDGVDANGVAIGRVKSPNILKSMREYLAKSLDK